MSVRKGLGLALCVLLVIGSGAYWNARQRLLPLDDQARARAPGRFVELSDGRVHYDWHGPVSGRVLVMVHGFSTPSYVWRGLLEPLTQAGFRVLTFDNYGRGWSDRPAVANDAQLFERQILDLLRSQDVQGKVDLVGYSMGGAIAVHFSANHPERVRRLALIAPAGLHVETGVLPRLLLVPVVGDWLMAVFGERVLLSTMAKPENSGRALPDLLDLYAEQSAYDGYLRSLLSSLRNYPMGSMEAEYAMLGKSAIPVAAIWGELDAVVPASNSEQLARLVPGVDLGSIAGGTHAITYSEPEAVSAFLIRFLTASLDPAS